jgi:probable rRNA maturation factor
MKIEINKLSPEKVDMGFLKRVASKTCKVLSRACRGKKEISIVLVDGAKIKALNKKYLKRNRVTDVLAFDYGEIIICLPQAKRQAKELGHSLKEELATLLIHGILHLAGYNNETKKDFNRMLKRQNKIFKEVYGKK